ELRFDYPRLISGLWKKDCVRNVSGQRFRRRDETFVRLELIFPSIVWSLFSDRHFRLEEGCPESRLVGYSLLFSEFCPECPGHRFLEVLEPAFPTCRELLQT